MPTTLSTLSGTELHVRYKTPILTKDLNQKLAVISPRGVYRGFRVVESATNLSVDVEPDPDANDHVAVVLTDDGYGVTVRLTGGSITLDLGAYASKTVIVAIYVDYTPGEDTAGEIRAYELSPSDEFTGASERDELVVLGQVELPASGTIPADDVTPAYRDSAWAEKAQEAFDWVPLVRDPSFQVAYIGADLEDKRAPFWTSDITSGSSTWKPYSLSYKFGDRCMSLQGRAGATTGSLYQRMAVPITPGQYYKIRFWKRVVTVPSAGVMQIRVWLGNQQMAQTANIYVSVDISGYDASWVPVEVIGRFRDTTDFRYIRQIGIQINGVTYSGTSTGVLIDGLQMFLEDRGDTHDQVAHTFGQDVFATEIVLRDPTQDLASSNPMAKMVYDDNYEEVTFDRADGPASATADPIDMELQGQTRIGTKLAFTDAQAETQAALLSVNDGNQKILLFESEETGTGVFLRAYVNNTTGNMVELTWNAYWDSASAQWDSDDSSYALLWELGNSVRQAGMRCYDAGSNPTPWSSGSWVDVLRIDYPDGDISVDDGSYFVSNPTTYASGSNRPWDDYTENMLIAKSIIKGWGHVTTGGGGPTINQGWNMAATLSYSGNNLLVTLDQAFPAADEYAVVASISHSNAMTNIISQAAGSFQISATNSAATPVDLSSSAYSVMWILIGQET